jgi:bifunctional ADP-heptose synthase (sugar kinase/adenylyltransferase)
MTEKQYFTLLNLLKGINKQISKIGTHPISEIWLTKIQVKQIFGYSPNSLRSIEEHLEISKIKGRKFYSTKSILDLFEVGKINYLKMIKKIKNEQLI